MITLESGDTELVVSPQIGGSIISFRVGGADVLRPTPPGAFHPLQTACFPMVPWVNRIAAGRFTHQGRSVRLPAPIEGELHALHGHGWLAPWTETEVDDDFAVLACRHVPGHWPWAYEARQTFALEPGRVSLSLSVTNLTDDPMPAGLGFHPYFESPARLSATVDGMWHTDADLIPDRWDATEPFRAHDVDGLSVDNTFTGWDRRAIVEARAGRILVTSDLDYLHIYAPRGRGFFCLEPASAVPDALNHPERGLRLLGPGEDLEAELRISLG